VQLAARGPSGSRRPSAEMYTRRHTEITRSLPRYKGIKGNSSGRTEGRGNKAVNDGEARERERDERK
jgi:hypothetical protein